MIHVFLTPLSRDYALEDATVGDTVRLLLSGEQRARRTPSNTRVRRPYWERAHPRRHIGLEIGETMHMTDTDKIVLFHSPNTRSGGTLILLEELGAPYQLRVLNMQTGEQRQPAFLAVNPMGKVPAILHGDVLVTEQVAIFLYLADLFPEAGLAPPVGDRRRGPYLRWMAFYAGCFEPAVVDQAMKRAPAPAMMSPYGDFGTVMATLNAQLRSGPFLLGEAFSAADVLWGAALTWTTMFGLVPVTPEIKAYIDRTTERPAVLRVREQDAALAAQHKMS
jgi:glutathione S-transferase